MKAINVSVEPFGNERRDQKTKLIGLILVPLAQPEEPRKKSWMVREMRRLTRDVLS